MKLRVLAIIPARGGSKRVPNKNFRQFARTTLTALAIEQALNVRSITDIVLSSDSEEVLKIGSAFPQIYCIKRPVEISGDLSPAIEYVHHALQLVEKDKPYDAVVILQPSSPLRLPSDIDNTINILLNHPEADSAVSVMKVNQMVHPLKLKRMEQEDLLPFFEDEKGRFAAHELPDAFVRNCAVYVTWRKGLESRSDVIGKKSLGYLMPAERSVDINEILDFEFAEYLYKKEKSV